MADEPRKPTIRGRRIIERPRLTCALDLSTARIRMLVAGSGYGKTILLEQWAPRDGRVVGWFRARPSATDVAVVARGLARAHVDRRSTSRHTDARAARHHAGSRTRSRSARGDAGRGSRLVAGRRPGRDRRLPPPRRVRGNGAIRRDARRCCPRRAAAGEPSAPCMGAPQGHPVRRGARGAPVRARDEHRRGRARPRRLARGDARARCAGRRLARRRRSRGDGSRRRRRRATLSRGPLRPLRGRDLSWARPDAPHGDRDTRCDAARRPGARRDRPRAPTEQGRPATRRSHSA